MNKNYFGFFIVLLLASCSDSFDGKNGIKVVKFPGTDKICQTVEFKDGKKNGVLKEYFENGNIKTVQHFKDNKNVDTALYYHPNGKLAAIQIHDNGDKVGCWKKYNEAGALYSDICFVKDRLDGTSLTYTYKTLHLIIPLPLGKIRLHIMVLSKHGLTDFHKAEMFQNTICVVPHSKLKRQNRKNS